MILHAFLTLAFLALLAPCAGVGSGSQSPRCRVSIVGAYVLILALAIFVPAPFDFVADNLLLGSAGALVRDGVVAGAAFVSLALAVRLRDYLVRSRSAAAGSDPDSSVDGHDEQDRQGQEMQRVPSERGGAEGVGESEEDEVGDPVEADLHGSE